MKMALSGAKALDAKLSRLAKTDFQTAVDASLARMAARAAGAAAAGGGGTPVATGVLRASVRKGRQAGDAGGDVSAGDELRGAGRASSAKIAFGGSFGYTAPYAPDVEFGHSQHGTFVPGRHFLRDNVEIETPLLKSALRALLEDA